MDEREISMETKRVMVVGNEETRPTVAEAPAYADIWFEMRKRMEPVTQRFTPAYKNPENICIVRSGETIKYKNPLPGRNAPCPCGSALKFKKCCQVRIDDERAEKLNKARYGE